MGKWIDINKQKPKEGERVLVQSVGDTNIVISTLENDSEFGWMWEDDDLHTWKIDTVKCWMKLPKCEK